MAAVGEIVVPVKVSLDMSEVFDAELASFLFDCVVFTRSRAATFDQVNYERAMKILAPQRGSW